MRWRTKIPTKYHQGIKVDLVPSMHRQWPVCRGDHDLFSSRDELTICLPRKLFYRFFFPRVSPPPTSVCTCTMGHFESKMCIKCPIVQFKKLCMYCTMGYFESKMCITNIDTSKRDSTRCSNYQMFLTDFEEFSNWCCAVLKLATAEIWKSSKLVFKNAHFRFKIPTVYCAHPIQMEELYKKKSAVSD